MIRTVVLLAALASTPVWPLHRHTEWGVKIPKKAKVYVDGKRLAGDPHAIQLRDRREIAIVGKPPAHIPSNFP